jgi:putative PIN family toxin of toxin-antitoxin system
LARVVIDTGVIISGLIQRKGTSRKALNLALQNHTSLISFATFSELKEVIFRPKFEHFFTNEDKLNMLKIISMKSEQIEIRSLVKICRDSKDDMFLNLAIDGQADVLLTRDPDLLALHPFREIPILSPADFLNQF